MLDLSSDIEDNSEDSDILKVQNAALRLIARAEQYSLGLRAKLIKRGFPSGITAEVILDLSEKNLINDERYAELWIRSRISGGRALSPRDLQSSLGKKGIDNITIKKALETALDSSSESLLLKSFLKKKKNIDETAELDEKTIRNLWAELKYEGFSAENLEIYFENNL